jgi:Zn finger protein HypA/HybF involved in hydrogenase expression
MRLIGYTDDTHEFIYQCEKCKKVNILKGDKYSFVKSIDKDICILKDDVNLKCDFCNNIHPSDIPLFHDDEEMDKIQCPKCHSTQIQLMKRGWKLTTGFLGSSRNERVCLACKHKF